MPQSKEVHREYMKRRREGSQQGSQNGVGSQRGSQVYPAIVRAITDPKIRSKVERISEELNSRGLGNDVRYGIDGPTFDIVKELIEVTR